MQIIALGQNVPAKFASVETEYDFSCLINKASFVDESTINVQFNFNLVEYFPDFDWGESGIEGATGRRLYVSYNFKQDDLSEQTWNNLASYATKLADFRTKLRAEAAEWGEDTEAYIAEYFQPNGNVSLRKGEGISYPTLTVPGYLVFGIENRKSQRTEGTYWAANKVAFSELDVSYGSNLRRVSIDEFEVPEAPAPAPTGTKGISKKQRA